MGWNFLDLFSGIGGFALGAYWAGWKFDEHYYSEVDDYACKVYQARFPDAIPLGDVWEIDCSALPPGEWIVTGGFPCQDISCAGKREGIEGERSSLWFAMRDVIRDLHPRWVVAENVGAIAIRGLAAVVNSLTEIGYDCEWQDIRASDVGAPHRRERIWIVAYPRVPRLEKRECLRSNLESQFRTVERSGQDVADSTNENDRCSYTETIIRQGTKLGESCSSGRRSWSAEPDVGRVAHGIPSRIHRLKCLGNAIVPQIAELLFRRIEEIDGQD